MLSKITMLKKRYPLHLQIAVLFTLLIVFIGSTIVIFSHNQLSRITEASTNRQYQRIGEAIATELSSVTRNMMMSVNIMAEVYTEQETLEQRMASIAPFFEILQQNDYANSIYSAYPDGDFFIIRRLYNVNRILFHAPDQAQWLVHSYRYLDTLPEKQEIYLDKERKIISQKRVDYDNYDPRIRSWYQLAEKNDSLTTSPLYTFKGTGEMGFTYSIKAINSNAIIGLDVSLAQLSNFLKQNLPAGSQAAIINSANETIASHPPPTSSNPDDKQLNKIEKMPVLSTLLNTRKTYASDQQGQSTVFSVQGEEWYGSVVNFNDQKNQYQLAIATPSAYLTKDAKSIRDRSTLIAFVLLLISLPLVWYFSLRISRPLIRLRQDADAISHLHFDKRPDEHSIIEEVNDLHKSMSKMKLTLKQFISMGSLLSAKDNFPLQMQGLLNEINKIADMRGGVIFLSDKEGELFSPIAFNWEHHVASTDDISPLPFDKDNPTSFWQVLEGNAVSGCLDQQNIPSQITLLLQQHLPLRYIAVPMQTHEQKMMGFLLLFSPSGLNAEREKAKIQLINALVGSLSVTIETQYLLQEQKNLLNAFIELIAGAIDTKSAYTGGHCHRVPVITKMLAKAAVDAQDGPFADFKLSVSEWEELHTACWLHDCGKITTPEAIVDKATKLELIYDRIHEVRMRFEVLKREKEIGYLHKYIELPESDQQQLSDELQQLDNDFYFIAQCNVGGEFLSDGAISRIQQIAQYQWTRTLDDRSGIANEELMRKTRQPAANLPIQEPILSDKEEHIVYREAKDTQPENYHFKLKEPKLLYNHGEIYNLSIRRGTLSEEERYKINEHIIQTIIMLKKLPFPRAMANVPVIAGGHHERMDGKGYPYQLNYTQMSLTARMLAIADVFEALTADDRPYKPGKLLSESLNIMTNMVNENHLDRELFILFLQSGIWHDYAMKNMKNEKIDAIDINLLLEKIGPQIISLDNQISKALG